MAIGVTRQENEKMIFRFWAFGYEVIAVKSHGGLIA
jgi:hypothetical protein